MPVMAESTRMHENTAEELLSQARTLQDEGSYEEAVPLLQKAADMGDAPAVSAKDMTLTVEEICQAGAAAYDVGDYAKAAVYYELALKCYREAAGKGEEVVAEEPDRLVDEENAASNATVDTGTDRLAWLQALNRASIANMSIGEGPVYVIGHRSPDSDTICSAIAYARLLTMLGYPAEAAANGPVNHETAFILKAAGTKTASAPLSAMQRNISGKRMSKQTARPNVWPAVRNTVTASPGLNTSDSWKCCPPSTSMSNRCALRWLARSWRSRENTNEAL